MRVYPKVPMVNFDTGSSEVISTKTPMPTYRSLPIPYFQKYFKVDKPYDGITFAHLYMHEKDALKT